MKNVTEIVNEVFREHFNHVTPGTPLHHQLDAARTDIIARCEKIADDAPKATKKHTA